MAFEQTWRWFGPNDPITLKEIKQTGATGIVTALHHIPAGDVWTEHEIMKRKQTVESEGLRWSVAESIPVHEHLKKREGAWRQYVANYKESIRNLGRCGIDTVCYNFMPVLDWSRTDLEVEFNDGSITTKFEANAFAAFDLFILKRSGAEESYADERLRLAKLHYDSMNEGEKERLVQTVLLGFPGSGEAYTLEQLKAHLQGYRDIGEHELRDNLRHFIKEIIPTAEECGVVMGIHPDDPPWPLLGLPRVVSTGSDVEHVLSASDSPSNGITFCTGSFGAGPKNDLVDMASKFAKRISFLHLRNVRKNGRGDFVEADHLDGDVDMYSVIKAIVLEQQRRVEEGRTDNRMPMRPDHGRLTFADQLLAKQRDKQVYPGYSLAGRMRALAELRGLELGIRRSLGLEA